MTYDYNYGAEEHYTTHEVKIANTMKNGGALVKKQEVVTKSRLTKIRRKKVVQL